MAKFFNKKVWIVPGNDHRFRSEHDAKYYCEQHGIDFSGVERYDSIKEYERWLELQQMEREGKISELKRQVEFVLTPRQYERIKIREKEKKYYYVPAIGGYGNYRFETKKDAVSYTKLQDISTKLIFSQTVTEPVYKEVTLLDKAVYTADFTYIEGDDLIVEDCKSEYTKREADYVLRKKFLYYKYRILIRET